jgi:hypothetical protein
VVAMRMSLIVLVTFLDGVVIYLYLVIYEVQVLNVRNVIPLLQKNPGGTNTSWKNSKSFKK